MAYKITKQLAALVLALALLLSLAACGSGGSGEELVLFTWENMFPQEVLDGFTRETGIAINYANFDTDENMLARLEAAGGGESLPAEMALDSGEGCAPAAVQSDSAAVESGKVAMPPQTPAAAKRTEEAAGGRTLAASGPAVRAWVESELGLPWEPGTAYKLTAEQYLELTALLAEAGENFEESPGEAESWLLLASGEE